MVHKRCIQSSFCQSKREGLQVSLSSPSPPFRGHKRACVAVLNTVKQCHHIHRARQLQQLSYVTRFVQFTQTGVVTAANIIGKHFVGLVKMFHNSSAHLSMCFHIATLHAARADALHVCGTGFQWTGLVGRIFDSSSGKAMV